jgi:3-phosphoshikimate 1-carboxyvinyltransferase
VSSRLIASIDGPIDAVVEVPGSKSIANRALVCAALAQGQSVLRNVPDGDDTEAMLDGLHRLGIGVDRRSDVVTLNGCGGSLPPGPVQIDTRLAGTTSRFLTALCALGRGPYTIDGGITLRSRPMRPLHDALEALGAHLHPLDQPGHLPVVVEGPLRGGCAVEIRGDISSQFLTALMLVAPYVAGGMDLRLSTPLVSRPYVDMTAAVMASFGHDAVEIGDSSISVGPGRYRNCEYVIEPDASSASYPLAAAAICGGTVTVPGLGVTSLQGDAAFAEMLTSMGCTAQRTAAATTVHGSGRLVGIDVDMVDHSDLVPTVAAAALFASSQTRVRGVGFIRSKESDRLGDLCSELRSLGASATDDPDGLSIQPATLHGAELQTHHDHRLAMAFGLVGLRVPGVTVLDADVVSKSWPAYWEMLEGLR